ncbi:hypothetical protein [Nocardioides sp. NPDC047086]|uniref:hypothetical protein n=1 Tax=Nocardioides sp. NPDC047086 TaxID=3154810 RepID=UPI0033DB7631
MEISTWIDGALLVDLWDDLDIPRAIREAWQPAVDLAGAGPVEHARSTRDAKRTDEVIVADPILLTRREAHALVAAEERHEARIRRP